MHVMRVVTRGAYAACTTAHEQHNLRTGKASMYLLSMPVSCSAACVSKASSSSGRSSDDEEDMK
eukprot:6324198-Amphidinium_carterae.2